MSIEACPFNLNVTLCCGQVFRWHKRGEWWYSVAGSKPFKVQQENSRIVFHNIDRAFIENYFSLDHDLQRISNQIDKDIHIKKALKEFWGLRIIRQEPWECLISFICATYKSVAAIKNMLQKLSAKFGEKTCYENLDFYSFPTPERLANATLKDLEECALGYRAKYVQETARKVYSHQINLETLSKMPYVQAKKILQELPGVGSKVADCILLFSMNKLEAFPVDIWVKRIILKYYSQHFQDSLVKKLSNEKSFSNSEYEKLNAFGRTYFGEYAGYAQEYLYHYERLNH